MYPDPTDLEAHIIREPSKSFAKSVCALQAEKRWAVTVSTREIRATVLFVCNCFNLRLHTEDVQP